jgi:hypothetical protein
MLNNITRSSKIKNFKKIDRELKTIFQINNARAIKLNLIDKDSKTYKILVHEQNQENSILQCMPAESVSLLQAIYLKNSPMDEAGYCKTTCYDKIKKAYKEFKKYREYLSNKKPTTK